MNVRCGRSVVLVVGLLAFVGACGAESDSGEGGALGWSTHELGPLSARNDPVVAALDDEVFVVGGNEFYCGPTEDCAWPDVPPLRDGAIFDLESAEWRTIADAPLGVDRAEAVTLGGAVFVVTQCDKRASCPTGRSMLRYDVVADAWSLLAPIPGKGYHLLTVVDEDLYAISASDEQAGPDYRYDGSKDVWVALERPPLPETFDRFGVDVGGALVLYGSPIDGAGRAKVVARLDPETDTWTRLDDAPGMGWQVFDIDDVIVLNPHFGSASGGVHDVATDTWTPLPEPPAADSWRGDIAGVIGDSVSSFTYEEGWMLDLRADDWVEVAAPDGAFGNTSITTVEGRLVAVGGHWWDDDEQRLDGGLRIWTPPQR